MLHLRLGLRRCLHRRSHQLLALALVLRLDYPLRRTRRQQPGLAALLLPLPQLLETAPLQPLLQLLQPLLRLPQQAAQLRRLFPQPLPLHLLLRLLLRPLSALQLLPPQTARKTRRARTKRRRRRHLQLRLCPHQLLSRLLHRHQPRSPHLDLVERPARPLHLHLLRPLTLLLLLLLLLLLPQQ